MAWEGKGKSVLYVENIRGSMEDANPAMRMNRWGVIMANNTENPLISFLKDALPYLVTGAYAAKKLLPSMMEKNKEKKAVLESKAVNEIYDDYGKLGQKMYTLLSEAPDEKIKQMASEGNEYAINEAIQRGLKF